MPTRNRHSSGWIVYSFETWKSRDGEIDVPADDLGNLSMVELLTSINPLLVQAMFLPDESQFLYERGRSDIIYLTDHDSIRLSLME